MATKLYKRWRSNKIVHLVQVCPYFKPDGGMEWSSQDEQNMRRGRPQKTRCNYQINKRWKTYHNKQISN